MKETRRNIGIDCLKIICMLMVVMLHVLGQGGILQVAEDMNQNYKTVCFLEIASLCAVNCYALISGYVGIKVPYKFSNMIQLWIKAAFYSIGITLIFALINSTTITFKSVLQAVSPVIFNQWWYFTAYTGLFLVRPFINDFVLKLNNEQGIKLIIILLVMFSVIPTVTKQDIFGANNGYSFIWVVVLYIIGAIIRNMNLFENISAKKALIGYGVSVFVTWAFMQGMYVVTNVVFGYARWYGFLNSYTSPTIVTAAIFLLLGFSRLQFNERVSKVVTKVVPLTFSVYLIHTHRLVFTYVIKDLFCEFATLPWIVAIVAICLTVLFVFTICCIIDVLRKTLFDALKVRYISERVCDKLSNIFQKIINT